jgi:Transposase family tnp2
MKIKYLMMSLLISGPRQPGNDIDVYLTPLIEDLQKLWKEGVEVYDSYLKEYFPLHAIVVCTVNDYPALANLSGYKNKGAKACVICQEDTHTIRLTNYKKNIYMGHRRHLAQNHPYRDWTTKFDGKEELEKARQPLSARTVYETVRNIKVQFGKKSDNSAVKDSIWKKKSIFWDLPYWQHLEVRHYLDEMHIIKNIVESIIGLLLNIPGKTKDGIKA